MFDRRQDSLEANDKSDKAYHHAVRTLFQQIRAVIEGIDDVSSHLSPAYAPQALSQLSKYFEDISREFSSYTLAANNMFYEVLHRSKLRTRAARSVSQQARRAAKLFEKYSRKPKSYSAVDSRLAIHRLHDVLENLASLYM